MGGTLLQLSATNAADVFLTGDPQFSFFKVVYYRSSAFSLETKEYLVPSNFNNTCNFYLPTDGDLISKVYLKVEIPSIQFKTPTINWESEKWLYYNIVEQPHIPYYVLQTNTVDVTTVTPTVSIKVQNDVGRVLNTEILERIKIGISTQIDETINDDTIFSNILNQVRYFYSKQFSSIPSGSIINSMYSFYTNYSSINLQYINNNSIFTALLVNYLINILVILYNNINAFVIVIQISLVYNGSAAFSDWKENLSKQFANTINIPTTYSSLNSYQISSLLQNVIIYATNYVNQIDAQVKLQQGIANIEQLNTVVSTYTSGFNSYLFDALVNLGYDYYYLFSTYHSIAINYTRSNLITIRNSYYLVCNNKIIDYLYSQYLNNNASVDSSIKVSSLPDYSPVFKNAFLLLIDTIASKDPTYNNIKQYYLNDVYKIVSDSLIAGSSTTLQNILDECTIARTRMLSLINRFIYDISYLFNYQTIVLEIPTLTITSSSIDDFKKSFIKEITVFDQSLIDEKLVFNPYSFFIYNRDTEIFDKFIAAKGDELTSDEIIELQNAIDSISYYSDYSILKIDPFTQPVLQANIDILRDYVQSNIRPFVNVYEEFNINRIIDDYTYLSNISKILSLISDALQRPLTDTETTSFTTVINSYNTNGQQSSLALLTEYGFSYETILSWFDKYPQHDTSIDIINVNNINPFKDTVILQAILNEVFLEEMYYEYVYEKLLVLLNVIYYVKKAKQVHEEWFVKLKDISVQLNLTPYETQVLYSYHFFNASEIQRKLPKATTTLTNLFNKTPWNEKLTYLNIINYNEYVEYCRTNKSYFTRLYYEFVKKVNNKKVWKVVKVVKKYNIPLTVVEEFYYTPKIQSNLERYTFFTYKLYEVDLLTSYDSKYESIISKLLEKHHSLKKPSVVEIVTKGTLVVLNLSEGRQNVLINTIQDIFISSGYQVIFYREPNYYRKIVTVKNTESITIELNRTIIEQLNLQTVKSMLITKIESLELYKGLRIFEPNDLLNNDIDLIWDENNNVTLKRKIPKSDNIFLYYEALRWMIYNDYHDILSLIRHKPKLYKSWADADNTQPFAWVTQLGHKLIENCELFIDDSQVDSVNDYWLNIYSTYFQEISQARGYNQMVGNVPQLTTLSKKTIPSYTLFIPLPFWFCKEPFLSLPIISLTKTKVLLKIKYRGLNDLIKNYTSNIKLNGNIKTNILIQYVYLDLEERMNFIEKKHYFLISRQRIFVEKNISPTMLKFKFSNPISDIFLSFVKSNDPYTFLNIIDKMRLVLNGKVINKYKDAVYYSCIEPYNKYKGLLPNMYTISFNLFPTQAQPSGSMNFSYINHGFIDYQLNIDDLANIHAIIIGREYNILQVMSGQAALLFK